MTQRDRRAAKGEKPVKTASLARYVEIQRDFQQRIASGDWQPGRRLPPEHEIQEQYGCSRMTVSKAMSALARAGLIVRKRRSGSFVASPKYQETILEIHDIKAEIKAAGEAYRFSLLSREKRAIREDEAGCLGIEPGDRVLAVTVLHHAADRAYVLEERLINLAVAPGAADEPFSESPPGTWLLELIPWTEAEHVIRAENAGADVAKRLGIEKDAACLVVERRTWQAGKTVTWVRLTYPGARHQFVGSFKPGNGLDA